MEHTAAFLVVDDDHGIVRALQRVLSPFGEVRGETSVAGALGALACSLPRLAGVVIDIELGDGSGLDFLNVVREQHPEVPVLMCTGSRDANNINRAFDLGAAYVCKPLSLARMRHFAMEALGALANPRAKVAETEAPALRSRLGAVVDAYAAQFGLSAAETAVVSAVVWQVPHAAFLSEQNITENTRKTRVKYILKKTRESTMQNVRAAVMRLAADTIQGAAPA